LGVSKNGLLTLHTASTGIFKIAHLLRPPKGPGVPKNGPPWWAISNIPVEAVCNLGCVQKRFLKIAHCLHQNFQNCPPAPPQKKIWDCRAFLRRWFHLQLKTRLLNSRAKTHSLHTHLYYNTANMHTKFPGSYYPPTTPNTGLKPGNPTGMSNMTHARPSSTQQPPCLRSFINMLLICIRSFLALTTHLLHQTRA